MSGQIETECLSGKNRLGLLRLVSDRSWLMEVLQEGKVVNVL